MKQSNKMKVIAKNFKSKLFTMKHDKGDYAVNKDGTWSPIYHFTNKAGERIGVIMSAVIEMGVYAIGIRGDVIHAKTQQEAMATIEKAVRNEKEKGK